MASQTVYQNEFNAIGERISQNLSGGIRKADIKLLRRTEKYRHEILCSANAKILLAVQTVSKIINKDVAFTQLM